MKRALAAIFVSATACAVDTTLPAGMVVSCAQDADCFAPSRCLADRGVCVDPSTPCLADRGGVLALAPDGAACAFGSAPGVCVGGGCVAAGCGDGFLDPKTEECDDGAKNSDEAADACRRDCRRARCGDGVIDSKESCDGAVGANASCLDCTFFCKPMTADCDGRVANGCECAPQKGLDFGGSDTLALTGVAARGDYVYWLDGGDSTAGRNVGVFRAKLGAAPAEKLSSVATTAYGGDLVVDGSGLWFRVSDTLYRAPLDGGNAVEVATGLDAFALDATHVYLARGTKGLGRAPKDATASVQDLVSGFVNVSNFAVGAGLLGYGADLDGVLRVLPVGGGQPSDVSRFEMHFTELRGDAGGLYWLDGRRDLKKWTAGWAEPRVLAKQPAAQVGLEATQLAVEAGRLYANVESPIDDRQPGGVLAVATDGSAWRMVAGFTGRDGRFAVGPGRLYYFHFVYGAPTLYVVPLN